MSFPALTQEAVRSLVDRLEDWADFDEPTVIRPHRTLKQVADEWLEKQRQDVRNMHAAMEGAAWLSSEMGRDPINVDGANEAAPGDGSRLVGQAAHLCGDPDRAGWEVGALSHGGGQ